MYLNLEFVVFSDRIYLCLSTLPIPMWNYCDQSSEMKSSASREEGETQKGLPHSKFRAKFGPKRRAGIPN